MKNVIYLLAVVLLVQLASCSSSKKTGKADAQQFEQKQFGSEQIESDALAMAEITCVYEVKKYYAGLQPENRKLQRELKDIEELKAELQERMKIRYLQIPDLKRKYTRVLEKADEHLTSCKKRDDIEKMKEAMEKKAQEAEDKNTGTETDPNGK